MSATAEEIEEEPVKKSSKLPLILGLVLAIAGGAGGFFAVQMGLIGGSDPPPAEEEAMAESPEPLPMASYVPLDPLVINLPPGSDRQFLRFVAQLEVRPDYAEEVEQIKPRIVDVFNSYLRAVEPGDLESAAALTRIRAQLLRRVQVVAGEGRITDLLIMEFILN